MIVALTKRTAMADDRGKCIQAGCNDFATKPISKNILLGAAPSGENGPRSKAA